MDDRHPDERYTSINHTAFATNDMNLTIKFWRDLLRMKIVATMGKKGERQYFFRVSDTGFITFFEWSDVEPARRKHHGAPVKGPFIFDHISIGVLKLEELFRIQDEIEAADFPVSDVIDHGFIYSIYTYDPNGIPLEFSVMNPDVNISTDPKLEDKEPPETLKQGVVPLKGIWPEVKNTTPASERIVLPGRGAV